MPSKIKNAIGTGDVNVGFSAALRNPPVPEEKLVATLEYDDIGPRSNTGGYQFYRGTIPYLGRITDILQANNVRLGHTNSSNENVEAILNKRVRGETLRWEINSSNYIDWIVSSAVRARNNEHEFNITLKENGITNITTQSSNSHQFVDFKFYAVELVPDTAPPVPGQFGVFRWQSADYVNPQGAVNPGDIELSSNNREVDHLTNDNVEDVDVIGIEYENGTDLAQFVDSLNAGSSLIIYRDNQNVVKYNITASAPDQPAGANLFVRLDVSYADHHLGADGLDATGVDIPVHLGRLAGASAGGGSVNEKMSYIDSRVELTADTWTEISNVGISGNGNVLLDASVTFEDSGVLSSISHALRIRRTSDDEIISQFGAVGQLTVTSELSGEPIRLRAGDGLSGTKEYSLEAYVENSGKILWFGFARYRSTLYAFDIIQGEFIPLKAVTVGIGPMAQDGQNIYVIGRTGATSTTGITRIDLSTLRSVPGGHPPFMATVGTVGITIGNGEAWMMHRRGGDPDHLILRRDLATGDDLGNIEIRSLGEFRDGCNDGTTAWFLTRRSGQSSARAWDMSTGNRRSTLDFDIDDDGSIPPTSMDVFEGTMYVAYGTTDPLSIIAYDPTDSPPSRDSSKDITINTVPANNGGINYLSSYNFTPYASRGSVLIAKEIPSG